MILEWEPDSDRVGDFTWPGFGSDVVCTPVAVDVLRSVAEFEVGAVEMIQDRKLRRTARSKVRVWLPYTGPVLQELWPAYVHVDVARSTVERENLCGTCGEERWAVFGDETVEIDFDQETFESHRRRLSRLPGHGIVVTEEAQRLGLFRTYEFPAWICCTEAVRDAVVAADLTNVTFYEVGSIG